MGLQKNKKFTMKTTRRYLAEFKDMQKSIDENRKGFIANEESVIKNYGAIYLNKGKFHLTHEKSFKGNKVAEMNFHKTIDKKG